MANTVFMDLPLYVNDRSMGTRPRLVIRAYVFRYSNDYPITFNIRKYAENGLPITLEDEWWAGKDLHLRRRKPPDLQSGPVDYFGTDPRLKPVECMASRGRFQSFRGAAAG